MATPFRLLLAAAALSLAGPALAEDLPLNAQQFAGMMKQDDTSEIALAKQVAQKAQSADVRAYAQQLASDHQRALDELQQVADKNKLDLDKFSPDQLPKADQQLDKAFRTMRQAILASSGKELDQVFLGYSLVEHDHDIQTLTEAEQKFNGTTVGGLITSTLPMLREHRARAYQLLKQTGPQRQARHP